MSKAKDRRFNFKDPKDLKYLYSIDEWKRQELRLDIDEVHLARLALLDELRDILEVMTKQLVLEGKIYNDQYERCINLLPYPSGRYYFLGTTVESKAGYFYAKFAVRKREGKEFMYKVPFPPKDKNGYSPDQLAHNARFAEDYCAIDVEQQFKPLRSIDEQMRGIRRACNRIVKISEKISKARRKASQ